MAQSNEQLSNVHTQKISFSSGGSKNYHRNSKIKSLTAEKPYQCDYCDYRRTWKSNVQQHIRMHTGEKPSVTLVSIGLPGEVVYRNTLATLERSPTRVSTVSIGLPGEVVYSNTSHSRHTHTGEKPCKSSYCEFRSANKKNLLRHIITHAEQKPYKYANGFEKPALKSVLASQETPHSKNKKCLRKTRKFPNMYYRFG